MYKYIPWVLSYYIKYDVSVSKVVVCSKLNQDLKLRKNHNR